MFETNGQGRKNDHVISACGIVLDFEHIIGDRAGQILASLKGVAYQVHSSIRSRHNEPPDPSKITLEGLLEKTFQGEVRMHITIPFSRAVDPAHYGRIWTRFAKAFPDMDPSCKNVSRAYYTPATRPGVAPFAAINPGPMLDVDASWFRDFPADGPSVSQSVVVSSSKGPAGLPTTAKGLLYKLLDVRGAIIQEVEPGKWWVKCPNEAEHSSTTPSDCVLWSPREGEVLGSLACSHAHCQPYKGAGWLQFFSAQELSVFPQAPREVSETAFTKALKKLARGKGPSAAHFERLVLGTAFDASALPIMLTELARELPRADPQSIAAHFGSSLSFMAQTGADAPTVEEVSFQFARALERQAMSPDSLNLIRSSSGAPKPGVENPRRILVGDLDLAGRFKLNLFSDRVAVSNVPWDLGADREMNETDLTELRQLFERQYGLFVKPGDVLAAVMVAARDHAFHPVRDYISELAWDGKPRLDSWLVEHFGAADTPYTRKVGSYWLMQAVARVFQPGSQADYTLIFQGKQGVGKSQALANLAGRDFFSDDVRDVGERSAAEQLSGKWIVELAELASVKRADNEKVKGFITRCVDRYRVPYGRLAQDFKRQCVFCGSTNEIEYLADSTGNRRYWPVPVSGKDVDQEAFKAVRDQLWAEAKARYDAGEVRYPVGAQEKAMFEAAVERCRIIDDFETMLQIWVQNPTSYREGAVLTTRWFLANLAGLESPRPTDSSRMNAALFAVGFTRSTGTIRTWLVPQDFKGAEPAQVLALRVVS
jgi:predicted P-loop ATPase